MTESDPPQERRKGQPGVPNQAPPLPDGVEWGPAMRALRSDKHRAFVLALYTAPSHAAAARVSGFGTDRTSPIGWTVIAAQLCHNEKILAAIAEEDKRRVRVLGPRAIRAAEKLVEDPTHRDHARGISMMLDRTVPVETRHEVVVRHIDHDAEAIEQLKLMKRLGVVHEKLVEWFGYSGLGRYERMLEEQDNGKQPPMIEATAAEVAPADKQ
jgi:phage terminase small subunit